MITFIHNDNDSIYIQSGDRACVVLCDDNDPWFGIMMINAVAFQPQSIDFDLVRCLTLMAYDYLAIRHIERAVYQAMGIEYPWGQCRPDSGVTIYEYQ